MDCAETKIKKSRTPSPVEHLTETINSLSKLKRFHVPRVNHSILLTPLSYSPNRIHFILQAFLQAPSSGSPDSSFSRGVGAGGSSSSSIFDGCKFDLRLECNELSAFSPSKLSNSKSAHHCFTGNPPPLPATTPALIAISHWSYSLSAMMIDGSQRGGNAYGFSGASGGVSNGAGTGSLSSSSTTGGAHEHQPRHEQSKRFSVSFDESKAKRRRLIQEQVIACGVSCVLAWLKFLLKL